MRIVRLSLLVTCLVAVSPAGAAASDSAWRSSIRPYLYLSGLSGSVTVAPLTVPINSSFSELLDNLQIGGFVAFTAEKDRWGLYTDFQYIRLKGEGTSALGATLTLENLIFEGDVTFRPAGAPTLRFLGGLRAYSIDQTLTIGSLLPIEVNTTVFDPIVGAMGEWSLSETWDFEMRVDIGGFGVGSEFTYQLLALFCADLSRTVRIPFGYRVLGYQIQDGDVWMNTQMTGLVLGVDIRF
jgi:hypothetical protein